MNMVEAVRRLVTAQDPHLLVCQILKTSLRISKMTLSQTLMKSMNNFWISVPYIPIPQIAYSHYLQNNAILRQSSVHLGPFIRLVVASLLVMRLIPIGITWIGAGSSLMG